MTPVYDLNQSASPFPFVDLNEDDQQFTDLVPHQSAAAATSFHHDHYFSTFTHDQTQKLSFPESHQTDHQHKVNTYDLEGGSSDHHAISSSSTSRVTNNSGNGTDGSMKWMATKVRLQIRKIGSSSTDDHHRRGKFTRVARENSEEFNSTTSCDIVRVCSDCNTTKTPLWRSGPCGPKTLCNACGIRQRKARRALAVAAAETEAEANGGTDMEGTSTTHKISHNKEKKARTSYVDTQKSKLQEKDLVNTSSSSSSASPHQDNEIKRMNKFEEFAISLSKNSSFRRVFPRDEEEAAILLMALSCGLVHG